MTGVDLIVKEISTITLVEVAVEAVAAVEEVEATVATTREVGETGTKTVIGTALTRMSSAALSVGVVETSTTMIAMATEMDLVAMVAPGPLVLGPHRIMAHLRPVIMGRRRRPPLRQVIGSSYLSYHMLTF